MGELLTLQWQDVHIDRKGNITTTSRYWRSTTLRLERALTLLEQHELQRVRSKRKPRGKKNSKKSATLVPHGRSDGLQSDDRPDAEVADLIEDVVVSLNFASWNQIRGWLRRLDDLRCAA